MSDLELTMTWADVIATCPVWTPVPLHSYLPLSSGLTLGITSMDLFLKHDTTPSGYKTKVMYTTDCILILNKNLIIVYFLYWILRLPTKIGTPSLNHCRAGIGLPLALHTNFKTLLTFTVVLLSPVTPIGWTINNNKIQIINFDCFFFVYKHGNLNDSCFRLLCRNFYYF